MKISVLKALVFGASLSTLPAFAAAPDGLLTSKAKLSLWTTAGVRSTSVHVDTNDGVITLHGKVPSEAQRTLAEITALEIVGVRGVKNLLQVVAEVDEKRVASSDKDTMNMVQKRLKKDAELNDSSISVKSVDKGVVLLTGSARTLNDHLHAVAIVDRVPGVRRVASEVTSPDIFGSEEQGLFMNQPRASSAPFATGKNAEARSGATDMRMTTAVKLRLVTAANVPSTDISVDTEEGIVTLFGIVPTAAVKNAAGLEARRVSGVIRVQNNLEVVASAQRERVEAKDSDIERDLALVFKDRAEFKSVDADVKNGAVRLTGTVGSAWDEVNAVRMARQVAGVGSVDNQLKIENKAPETSRRD